MCANLLQALQNDLEDLPEDDEEDLDFTLDELLGPMESDIDDAEPTPAPHRQHGGKSAAKRASRQSGR